MRQSRSTVRTSTALAALTLLGVGVPVAYADTVEREVVVSDPADDVEADSDERQRLVDATDVTKVQYRVGDEPGHDGSWTVKIRISHGETLTGDKHRHRAVTRFAHNGDAYRLVNRVHAAELFVRENDAWASVDLEWMVAKGGDGLMVVKFPVSALGRAFTMENLRTRLTVTSTSIVDRTSTDEDLPVYPPR